MKKIYLCFVLAMTVLSSGCAITHDHKHAKGIQDTSTVNIINNPEVLQEGFVKAMTSWLSENGYEYTILPEGSSLKEKGWLLTYTGKWSWDVTIYLAKSTIQAYQNGVPAGHAKYSASSLNLTKWRSAEETIRKMMANLFFGETEQSE